MRTFQRRVANWKALNVSQIATLPQVRQPGEALQTDGTWLTELGVTIQGQPFKPPLTHSVLPYSNWAWRRLAQSELLAAVQLGQQSTLFELGYVPKYHQTDNSSAATRRLGVYEQAEGKPERTYTEGYLHPLDHFGLEPRVIHVGSPNENGDVKSANGNLLRKPGDFRNYRYHEDLFPRLIFRRAWEQLQQWHSPRQADLIYLRILRLAARTLECDVALALGLLEQEVESRRWRRLERLQKQSYLPPGKTLAQFDESRLPLRTRRMLPQLQTGEFAVGI